MIRLWFGKPWLWPNSWWVVRYLLPYNKLFHYAACLHDHLYSISFNKKRSDTMFNRLCLAKCNTSLQRIFANLYYKMVSKYGYLFFGTN